MAQTGFFKPKRNRAVTAKSAIVIGLTGLKSHTATMARMNRKMFLAVLKNLGLCSVTSIVMLISAIPQGKILLWSHTPELF
jgi:hypothetical protein